MQQEGPFYAHAMGGNPAHGEVPVGAAVAQSDHNPLENLHALALSFHNTNVNAHDVTRTELRNVWIGLRHLAL